MDQKIIAVNDKLLKKLKNEKKENDYIVQYREAILEILEKNNKINLIYIYENIPGQITIEELIKKIKIINKNIEIIFFLKEDNNKKEIKLKELGIKKIYNFKNKNKAIKNKNLEKKLIIVLGKPQTGKITIILLIIIYLIKNKSKILLINFKNYKNKKIKVNKYLDIYNEINLFNGKNKNIKKYYEKYQYIIINYEIESYLKIKKDILKNSYKNLLVIDQKNLKIEDIKEILKIQEKIKNKENINLNIIQNKYFFNSLNYRIIKNVFKNKNKNNIYKIYYNNYFKKLLKKFLNNKKIKIDFLTRKEIQKIIK